MTGRIPSETHSLLTHSLRIVLNGMEVFHSHCHACGRDFVRTAGTHHWSAAYIGVFRVEILPPEINERWLSEPCPGERCGSDEVDRLLRKKIDGERREL